MLNLKTIKILQNFFKRNKSKINFVHVDLLNSFKIKFRNKKDLTKKHFELMKVCTNNSILWFPTFNYQFPKKKRFNLNKDNSETGSFTELFRVFFSKWRTETPIYNIVGDGAKPKLKINEHSIINPFDRTSFFHLLYKMNSNIFFYGTEINSGSFIMYIEETMNKGILYRYKKLIKGKICDSKIKKNVTLNLSVRPLNKNFPVEYSWKKIEYHLIRKKLFLKIKKSSRTFGVLNLKKTTDFLQKKIKKDPFFLLNDKSKKWLKKFYKLNKRGISSHDFETKT